MPSWSSACFRTFRKDGDSPYHKCRGAGPSGIDENRLSLLNENRRAVSFVELVKKEGSTLGLIISGGIDKGSRPKITNLRPGSIAHRSDGLAVGDDIISVNGIRIGKLKHEEIVNLLKNAGDRVTLEVEYEIPLLSAEASLCVCPKVIQIKLEKGNDSFGFTLRGGTSSDSLKSRPLTITHVRFGGPADRDGIIKAGDRLLAIDGINLSMASLQEALMLLKQINQSALFTIEYDVSCIDAVKNATGPLFVEIDKTPGVLLGVNLTSLSVPEHTIVIESIRQASVAERCGALHVGDHILVIDNVKVDLMTSTEAMQLLKSAGETVKLEILPISQMVLQRLPEKNLKRALSNSMSNSGCKTIGHADTTEINIPSDHKGFGFTVQGSSFGSDILSASPFISDIERGSPAEKSGVLQVTDRILAVNGESTEGLSLDEVTQLVALSHTGINLITQFDVAEAVVPSSGTFVVKLAKRGGELGITVTDNPDSICAIVYTVELVKYGGLLGITVSGTEEPFDPILISGLTENGLAARTGALHVGDKILAINGKSLKGRTLSEVICILQTSGDTVTLKISKCPCSEKFEDETTHAKCIHCMQENRIKSFITPLPSIDSAVDSWDSFNLETSINAIKLKDKTDGHSSGGVNLPAMSGSECKPSTSLGAVYHDYEQDAWERKTHSSNSFSGSHSLSSDEEKESWQKVLEDLQTCGQSQLLREIERTILGFNENGNATKLSSDLQGLEINMEKISLCPSDTLSEKNLQELNSQIEHLNTNLKQDSEKRSYASISEHTGHRQNNQYNTCHQPRNHSCQPFLFSVPLPIEIHKVTLFKDQVYEDFGFSLSDGKYENGVYINSIRCGGPADISGVVKPLDRILQVNSVKTYNAGLIVPLIASAGDQIELVISRPAYENGSFLENTLGRTNNYIPWIDDSEKEDSLSPLPPHSQLQTLTKTL